MAGARDDIAFRSHERLPSKSERVVVTRLRKRFLLR
jgi:hypothetical protein